MSYIGVDLHSNRFTCNFIKDQETRMKTFDITLEKGIPQDFLSLLKKEDYVVFEASTNSFSFHDIVQPRVKEAYVADPYRLQIIHKSGKKNDKIDARKLNKMLKYHVESGEDFLPVVYVPDETIRKLRSLFTTYGLYKREITSQKNRIHSLLKQKLKPYNNRNIFTPRMKEEVLALDIGEEYRTQIRLSYETIEFLEQQAEKLKELILYTGRKYKKEINILTSISGISVFIALAVITDYAGDISRFKNGKHFSAYLRATPRVDSSNEKTYIGKTDKRGRKLSISLILQSVTHFKRSNPKIAYFYERKVYGKSTGKVRMAIARKMYVAMYYMLREGQNYWYTNGNTHKIKMDGYNSFIQAYENRIKENEEAKSA